MSHQTHHLVFILIIIPVSDNNITNRSVFIGKNVSSKDSQIDKGDKNESPEKKLKILDDLDDLAK